MTATRFHVGLHSSNLDRTLRFYRALLGVEPTKNLPDYVRFETTEPPLVLGLYPSPQPAGGALNHVGLRFPDSNALVEVQRRLEEAGMATQRQEGVECCYSKQTKFWAADPDRVLWEIYTLHEDIDHSGFDDAPAPAAPPPQSTWQHRLTDRPPERIPHADASLDEVLLEGTFNATLPEEALTELLLDAHRALKSGGRLTVHGLVGDRPFPGVPKLPGMASLVQRVPVETEPLEALCRAGFGGLFYEKLGDIHCFTVNGVELRELRLHGWKPGESDELIAVVYKGPFEQVSDESGTLYRRGESRSVPSRVADLLRAGPAADQFAFTKRS